MREIDKKAIANLRYLSATMITNAGSGHPGISLGSAPTFYSLYTNALKYAPSDPSFYNRDRLVLCAGHASAIYYCLLHACGFNISMEDLKSFRKRGSKANSHPVLDNLLGVDASAGSLGQGIPMAVGMAIAEKKLADRFNKPGFNIIDHYTFAFAGDGSMMEGMTNEASSLAGTLKLNKLIVLYDSNNITIEGKTDLTFTENVLLRYKALNWNTIEVKDGEDIDAITEAINLAKTSKDKPTIIKINTRIGFASPLENSNLVHGTALTIDELKQTKANLGINYGDFVIEPKVEELFKNTIKLHELQVHKEKKLFEEYKKYYPLDYVELTRYLDDYYSKNVDWGRIEKQTEAEATRVSSGVILQALAKQIPNLITGSADVAPSVKSELKGYGDFNATNPSGRNFHFGIREHAMASICNGIALHGGFRVACSTYMVFSDYMRHAIRMSAMMKLPVIYILSHDGIGVGSDGQVHQPVEYNAMYRATPDLNFFRPADRKETEVGYKIALNSNFPTILALTRQNVDNLTKFTKDVAKRGAYFVKGDENSDAIVYTSGSELQIALKASEIVKQKGINLAVVSVPSTSIFERETKQYKEKIEARGIKKRFAIEASNDPIWYKFIGLDGIFLNVNGFGETATTTEMYEKYGLTERNLVKQILTKFK